METLKNWYVIIAVIGFTIFMPVAGRTPLQWGLHALQLALNALNGIAS